MGYESQCVGHSDRSHTRTRGTFPPQGESERIADVAGVRRRSAAEAAGFPDQKAKATSVVGGLRTGDLVRAVVPTGSVKAGVYIGRLAIRATGSGNVQTARGTIEGIHVR